MAVNAYLIIDGVPGPSTSLKDAHDILSFSWGVSNTAVIGAGSSGGEARSGRANMSDLSIMKVADKNTPLMFANCCNGTFIKKVDIIYDKPMGDKQEPYFKIHMEDVLITSHQVSGSSENPVESHSYAYTKIKVSYNPEEEGKLKGFIDRGWDAGALVKW
ncbi:MAG TPA: type VI secretion system tube protein Hcp [Terracidiphilus sp.]|jgi:type VI secretion system secreted protein Hcp|nr:type VI secretion system tube protein Hcp [Terracidiphilus sp.]